MEIVRGSVWRELLVAILIQLRTVVRCILAVAGGTAGGVAGALREGTVALRPLEIRY